MPRAPSRARLQKLLAAAGVASRRGAEALITAGRVTVNGRPARLGDSADPERDAIALDGVPVALAEKRYWLVHKPRGVLTTLRDPHGGRTIRELLPADAPRVFPVGRLDRDTEGLVLLTNDGALAHALLHPSHEVEREYAVTVRGELLPREQRRLARGVRLDDGVTAPARVTRVEVDRGADTTTFHLTLIEGRKRQIRRALRALGHPVRELRRVRMGPLSLAGLPSGAARELSGPERAALERVRRRSQAAGAARSDAQPGGRSARKPEPAQAKRRARRRTRSVRVSN
jgi:23S rRNA pseudouridine2605 synthase